MVEYYPIGALRAAAWSATAVELVHRGGAEQAIALLLGDVHRYVRITRRLLQYAKEFLEVAQPLEQCPLEIDDGDRAVIHARQVQERILHEAVLLVLGNGTRNQPVMTRYIEATDSPKAKQYLNNG